MKTKVFLFGVLIALILTLTSGCIEQGTTPEVKVPEVEPVPELERVLVDSSWLSEHLNDPDVRILDLSIAKQNYDAEHIPNAIFVDWKTDITDTEGPIEYYNIADKGKIEALLSSLSVTPDTKIVLYDNLNNRIATRTFWVLRYYGHEKISILNGGTNAWKNAGLEVTTDVLEVRPTTYTISKPKVEYKADMSYVKENLNNPNVVIIDGRPSSMYTGEKVGVKIHTQKEISRRGHIPGAINVFWKDNLGEDDTFKSLEELRKLYESKGITKDKIIITYCNEGLHASPPWFVLKELLGYPNVLLYDGSMAEWTDYADNPLVTGGERWGYASQTQ